MKFERFAKLFILNIMFFFSATMVHANTPLSATPDADKKTTTILERMELTMKSNIKLMTPPIHLEETSLDEKLETYYEEFFDKLLIGAHKLIGTPYRVGGRSPKGFDCSGFTSYIFSRYGIKLSPSSRYQINDGKKITRDEVKKGDLIFFKGRNSNSTMIGHVGIVMDRDKNGNIRFIHSATSGGVRVSVTNEPYYARRYMGIVRVEPKISKL